MTADQPALTPEVAERLFTASRAGDTDLLVRYIDGGIPVDLTNDVGDTLLMLASYHGHEAVTRALLARGADANRANQRGQTPLAGAAFKGYTPVAAALIEAGADPDIGEPTARATAHMFERHDIAAMFGGLFAKLKSPTPSPAPAPADEPD